MTELIKRISTSTILIIISIISFYHSLILLFSLIFCLYQLSFEFFNIGKKIFIKKKTRLLFFLFKLLILIYLSILVISIFKIIYLEVEAEKIFLIFIISISISSDIGGYIFGKTFKGKKISRISPNKTYAGIFGSFFLSVIVGTLIFDPFIKNNNIIFLSFIISFLTQIGDFSISYLKRKAKIKDTGKLLPGHGGLLDRFDGIIISIPLGLLFNYFI